MADDWTWDELNNVDYSDLKISDLLTKEKGKIKYEYDFGDSWYHDIILEKILSAGKNTRYPVYIDRQFACPPEDSGGIWGYKHLLKVLENPEDKEYNDVRSWIGEGFDPEEFDKESVNKVFKKLIKIRKL